MTDRMPVGIAGQAGERGLARRDPSAAQTLTQRLATVEALRLKCRHLSPRPSRCPREYARVKREAGEIPARTRHCDRGLNGDDHCVMNAGRRREGRSGSQETGQDLAARPSWIGVRPHAQSRPRGLGAWSYTGVVCEPTGGAVPAGGLPIHGVSAHAHLLRLRHVAHHRRSFACC